MRIRIGRRTWSLDFVRRDDMQSRSNWGECDPPTLRAPKITVRRSLAPRAMLEVTIHELLHAVRPELSEEAVTDSASIIARVLYRLGARVEPPE